MLPEKDALVATEQARSRFAPHSEVLITSGGKLIRFDMHGPFATIYYWHDSMLASQDALEAYRVVLRQGRKMLAREVTNAWIVHRSAEGRALMEAHWRKLYAECDSPLEIFDNEAEALARVQQRLQVACNTR